MSTLRGVTTFVLCLSILQSPVRARERDTISPERIAVFPMASEVADIKPEWLEAAITDALVSVGRPTVLARTQIDAVLAEQRISSSDLVDPKSAVAAGKLLGATYVVTGRLLAATFEPGFFSRDSFRARAQLQLIDVETARIVLSETLVGERTRLVMRRGETLSKLSPAEREKSFSESAISIGLQFADRVNMLRPLEGYVVKADGERVAISLDAASGVKPNQEFFVYERAEPIRDPGTGETLSVDRRPLARLVVTSVEEKLAWTRIVVTHSKDARTRIDGELVDLKPPRNLLKPQMSIIQTSARAPILKPLLERARGRRR